MRKTKLLLVALMAMVGLSSFAKEFVVDQKFTTVGALDGVLFFIVDETDQNAFCFGYGDNGWDMFYKSYRTGDAQTAKACQFKLSAASGDGADGYYYLQAYSATGSLHEQSWAKGGYFNSQPATNPEPRVCFDLGLSDKNGQDFKNGAVWDLEVNSDGKFALKNIGTGLYLSKILHEDGRVDAATYSDPTYFTFCTLKVDLSSLKADYAIVAAEAESAGVDASIISAQTTAVESATTEEEVQACIQALQVAINVVKVNAVINGGTGVDLTSFVANAGFEAGSLTGWTSVDQGGHLAGNKNFSLMKGNDFVEAWKNNVALGNGSLTHDVIGLPAGIYRISADAQNIEQYNGSAGGTGLFLYANDDKVAIGSAANYSVYTTLAADGPLTIKFELDNCTGNWISYDNITLTYYAQASDIFDLAVAAADAALADAAYANITGNERSNLITVKGTPAAGSTLADYEAAADNIYAAIVSFTSATVVTNYNLYASELAVAQAISNTITVTAPTTSAEALAAFKALKVAEYNFVKSEYPYSATSKIGEFTTWTRTGTVNGAEKNEFTPLTSQHWSGEARTYYEQPAGGWSTNGARFTADYKKVCTLPAGQYVIKVAARAASGNNTTGKVVCSAATLDAPIPNLGDSGKGITTDGVASFDEGTFANNGNGRGWVWNYLPFTLAAETEVTLTVHVEADGVMQWFSVCDGELLSKTNIATAVAYDEAANNTIEDVDVANVTMTREIKASYNTVVLPFALTSSQVISAFGTGTEVYNYSENSDDAMHATINFTKDVSGAIAANVPVLVKATEASSSLTFEGVEVVAPTDEVKVAGKNFDFVGTYAPISAIPAGDYFIGNGAIYESEGNTSINAFRAYIKAKSATARVTKFFIDGVQTTAIEALEINGANNGKVYNLNGQEVKTAKKGLYIQNGKKFIVK